jgi:hypothetical protein
VTNAESALQYELSELMKQKVRKKLIGIDLPLTGLYLHLDRKKNNWYNRTLKNLTGVHPLFLDSTLTYESAAQMFDYLVNKGYFRPGLNTGCISGNSRLQPIITFMQEKG